MSRCICFDRPAGADELVGQVVEQFGVARPFAEFAEVARRADDAFAEMVLPDAVDHDAGRQRVVRPRQPFGQLQAAAARRDRLLVRRRPGFPGSGAARDRPGGRSGRGGGCARRGRRRAGCRGRRLPARRWRTRSAAAAPSSARPARLPTARARLRASAGSAFSSSAFLIQNGLRASASVKAFLKLERPPVRRPRDPSRPRPRPTPPARRRRQRLSPSAVGHVPEVPDAGVAVAVGCADCPCRPGAGRPPRRRPGSTPSTVGQRDGQVHRRRVANSSLLSAAPAARCGRPARLRPPSRRSRPCPGRTSARRRWGSRPTPVRGGRRPCAGR